MKNGYIITYYVEGQHIDQDILLGIQDAQDHINVAMEVDMCDSIILHCIDDHDVVYITEVFKVENHWYEVDSNNIMNTYTLVTL